MGPHRIGQRLRIAPRFERGEEGAELGEGARALREGVAGRGDEAGYVKPPGALAEEGDQRADLRRAERGAEEEIILGGEEVDRRAHQRGADDRAPFEQGGEVGAAKIAQACPEADVGWVGDLGLQAGQARDCRLGGEGGAVEQQLAGEGRAAQFAAGQDALGRACHLPLLAG